MLIYTENSSNGNITVPHSREKFIHDSVSKVNASKKQKCLSKKNINFLVSLGFKFKKNGRHFTCK